MVYNLFICIERKTERERDGVKKEKYMREYK